MKKKIQRSAHGLFGDVLRRVPLSVDVSADLRRVLVSNVEKLRDNATDIFAKEISKVLAKIDVNHIVDDILQNYTVRLEARIDLVPRAGGPRDRSTRKGKK